MNPAIKSMRDALLTGFRLFFKTSSLGLNAVLAVVCAIVALKLWNYGAAYMINAGGWPQLNLEYGRRVIAAAGLKDRLVWWSFAWAAYVFAAGFAFLALAGARAVAWKVYAAARG
ncbi:conserved hypothetical protein [Hyphomicrobiales bacterium]|jgi:hypothetical protein|nr:conserved hypothetical protein [Hyphomicrobiales bacterium]CAH1702209.1 conserved hypothetical protein [Hyphomicrobiales bacterium]CAI0346412.1 conserved hypothetical protein [Hyphomicrobiales bacterium]